MTLSGSSTTSITVAWPAYISASAYSLTYTIASTTTTLPDTTLLTSTIACTESSYISIYYRCTVSSDYTPYSPSVSFRCTSSQTFTLASSLYLSNLTLSWSSASIYIFGYYLWQLSTSGLWDLVTKIPSTSTSYNFITTGGTYQLGGYGFNKFTNISLVVTYPTQPVFTSSSIVLPSSMQSQVSSVITATISDGFGGVSTVNTILLLELRDVCSVSTGYECVRVSTTDLNYVPDLLSSYIYQVMEGTGQASVTFTPPLPGYYSMAVLALRQGVLAQYWNNIWFDGTFTVQIHNQINLQWTGYLVGYAAEFVSAKYFFFVKAIYSEEYTFTIDGDDYFRLYINGNLTIDSWNVSCQVKPGVYNMTAGSYYYFKLEFKQMLGTARLLMYWQSNSQGEQIVPTQYLYWPTRLPASPWVQTVTQGLSKATLCYFTAPTSIKAGYTNTIYMYSVNANGVLIDIPTDVYSIQFTDTIYYSSTYVSNGQSMLSFSLSLATTYSVKISLYGIAIKNSPFTLTVTGGDISATTTTTSISTSTSYKVGMFHSIIISPFDSFNNALTSSTGLSMSLSLLSIPLSSLSVSAPTDWSTTYAGQVITYSTLSASFKVYISGSYSIYFYINSLTVTGYPKTITVSSETIMVEHSSVTYTTTSIVAGSSFISLIQARDNYYNNKTDVASVTSTFTSSNGEVGSISITDGIITATITLTIAGTSTLTLTVNSISITMPQVTVSANSILSSSTSELTSVTTSVDAGSVASAKIVSKDSYGNIRYNPDDNYAITINDATWTVTDNKDGTYLIQFTPLIAETYSIYVYANSLNIKGSPGIVTAKKSRIRGKYSIFASVASVVAGNGLFNITSKDIGGNTITNPVRNTLMGNQYYISSFEGPQTVSINATFADYSAYNINFTTITKAGTYYIALGLVEQKGLKGFYYSDNSFTTLFQLLSYHNTPAGSPQYYTQKDSQVNFNWATGNPLINNVNIANLFSVKWTGKVYTKYTETYIFYVQCDYRARLTVGGIKLFDNISTGTIATSQSGSLAVNASSFYDIVLEYQNGGNAGYIFLQYSSTSQVQQTIPSSELYTAINSDSSPYTIAVTPTVTSPSACVVTSGDPDALTTAYSNKLKTITITAYDKYGNLQTATDTFFGSFQVSTAVVTITGSNGVYTGTFTLKTVGVKTLKLFVKIGTTGVVNQVRTIYITVLPGPAYAANSVVSGLANLNAGIWGVVVIKLYDQEKNALTTGGDLITVSILGISDIPSTQILITDLKTGSYSCTFVGYLADFYTFLVYVNGELGYNSTFTVYPLVPYPENCIIIAPSNITLGDLVYIEIYLYDLYKNQVSISYDVFSFMYLSTNPNMKLLKFNLTEQQTYFYNGTVDFSLPQVDLTGACTAASTESKCIFRGNLSLVSGIFASGVHAQYYANLDFSGVPLITQDEDLISYSWGSTVLGIDSTKISVHWEGFIQAPSSFSLQISGSDWAFFYKDTLEIMRLPDVTKADLPQSSYYWVQIWYNNTNDFAQFAVQWLDGVYVDVPKENWFRFFTNKHLGTADLVIESL